MSLKSFHLFFILVSILMAAGFGVWLLNERPMEIESLNVLAALLSFSVGGLLVVYSIRFMRKFKHLRYM